jgi:RNase P subunit RPR2
MDILKQLEQAGFVIQCVKCYSYLIDMDFSQGDGQFPSPALGYLIITCKNCGNKLEVEEP